MIKSGRRKEWYQEIPSFFELCTIYMVEIVGIKSQKDIEILFQLTHFTVLLVLDYAFII